ncbi:hypothetical protein [Nostoc sp. FACHB-888]|uniref:hypothetical protein n=1 Tax=Nostoc sp. FACHB-888 TaxID=2692842 RepID=UPI0016853E95|nr:hypothetical protein [Nostoc sp. FACHB-888]MBD2249002.1 hypothetical protein [Nostoc sp. FACHB-888]
MRLIQIELEVPIGLIRKHGVAMLLSGLITPLRKEATNSSRHCIGNVVNIALLKEEATNDADNLSDSNRNCSRYDCNGWFVQLLNQEVATLN